MVYLIKIENKLVKKQESEGILFLDIPRELTFTHEDEFGNRGFFSYNPYELSIELDKNIIFFTLDNISIDNLTFNTINELTNYLYSK
jgi:hypothetical protein